MQREISYVDNQTKVAQDFVRKYQGRYSFRLNLPVIPKAGQQSCKNAISCLKIRYYRETETSAERKQFNVNILTLKEAVLPPSLSPEFSVIEVNTPTSLYQFD